MLMLHYMQGLIGEILTGDLGVEDAQKRVCEIF